MKLYEMFSPIGAPKENDEIDWLGDLKFFIDNDNSILNRFIFPTIVKHERCVKDKDAYKLYFKPIRECLKIYVEKYDIVDADKKFSKGKLVELCKNIAEEQKRHILNGDYKNESVYEDIYRTKEGKIDKKISESCEIAESVSVDSAIRSIVATGDSIAKTYGDLKTMAEKWVYNNGTLKGFHRNASGVGKRWYDTFFWNKMENDLRTLLQKNPKAAAKIQDFLDIERDDRGHISFTTIGRSLPKILNDVGEHMGDDDLKRFGANWFKRQRDYEDFLNTVEKRINDEEEDDIPAPTSAPRDNVVGRQNAAAEDIVNQILRSIDKKAAGEIRNIIAREPNKLQALQRELAKRNIKVGESMYRMKSQGVSEGDLDEDWRKKLAAAGMAGMMAVGGVAGAADRVPNAAKEPIIATIVIDGEARRLDLTPKGFDDVRDAESFIKKFMKDRGIMDWQAKIERSQPGTGRYQRVTITGAGGLESTEYDKVKSLDEMFDMYGPVSNLEMAVNLLTALSVPIAMMAPAIFNKIKNKIEKMGSRRIINLLSRKQIKVDKVTKRMLERSLNDLQQALDQDDGEEAKRIALEIQRIAKAVEDRRSATSEDIRKVKGGYRLVSKKTGRNLGTYPTRAGAVERERQVQFFKHRGK